MAGSRAPGGAESCLRWGCKTKGVWSVVATIVREVGTKGVGEMPVPTDATAGGNRIGDRSLAEGFETADEGSRGIVKGWWDDRTANGKRSDIVGARGVAGIESTGIGSDYKGRARQTRRVVTRLLAN